VEWSERTGELKLTIYQFAQHEATIQYEERRKQAKYCHVQRDQEAGGNGEGKRSAEEAGLDTKTPPQKGKKGTKFEQVVVRMEDFDIIKSTTEA
tara:strand:+ start:490 stop:771 length:282 start_codon:yes stop_codon:yes gene_type:complete